MILSCTLPVMQLAQKTLALALAHVLVRLMAQQCSAELLDDLKASLMLDLLLAMRLAVLMGLLSVPAMEHCSELTWLELVTEEQLEHYLLGLTMGGRSAATRLAQTSAKACFHKGLRAHPCRRHSLLRLRAIKHPNTVVLVSPQQDNSSIASTLIGINVDCHELENVKRSKKHQMPTSTHHHTRCRRSSNLHPHRRRLHMLANYLARGKAQWSAQRLDHQWAPESEQPLVQQIEQMWEH